MAIEKRYFVFKTFGANKWKRAFTAATVTKEGGAIDLLYDHITTGPDGLIAVVYDTKKDRHVEVHRLNAAGITQLVAHGTWVDGINESVENNLIDDEIEVIANQLVTDIAAVPEVPVVDVPSFVLLTVTDSHVGPSQFLIPNPTEKQLKALRMVHGKLRNYQLRKNHLDDNGSKANAALDRIIAATVGTHDSVQGDKALKRWHHIWKDHLITEPFRSNKDVEHIACCWIG